MVYLKKAWTLVLEGWEGSTWKEAARKRKHFNHCWKYKEVKCFILCNRLCYSLKITKIQRPQHDPSLWEHKINTKSIFPLKNSLCDWMGICRNRLACNDTLRWQEMWWETLEQKGRGKKDDKMRKLLIWAGSWILHVNSSRRLGNLALEETV